MIHKKGSKKGSKKSTKKGSKKTPIRSTIKKTIKKTIKRRNLIKRQINDNSQEINPKELYDENEKRYLAIKNNKLSPNDWVYNKIILEIILHLHLIFKNYLKMAEIKLNKINETVIKNITTYLEKNNICFKIENVNYLYLFKNIDDMNLIFNNIQNNRGIKVADNLGEFYTCKSEFDEWKNYDWRIVIFCNDIEIFAQMCTEDKISKNIKTTMKVYNEIRDLFIELDKKRFKETIPNPLKISIYKTHVIK
jgi:RNA-binding protein YhbY